MYTCTKLLLVVGICTYTKLLLGQALKRTSPPQTENWIGRKKYIYIYLAQHFVEPVFSETETGEHFG